MNHPPLPITVPKFAKKHPKRQAHVGITCQCETLPSKVLSCNLFICMKGLFEQSVKLVDVLVMYYLQFLSACLLTLYDLLTPRNLKGGIGSLFDPCVNAMGRRPHCPSRMEVSYCTSGFGAIIQRDLRTLSLPCDLPCDNLYACMIWVHAGKATHAS